MQPQRILLATGNAHKAEEIRAILAPLLPQSIELVSLSDLSLPSPPGSVESGSTFTANSRAKALWCRDISGLASIADDSGLCVDCLGGAPGIRSARWAGPTDHDRNMRLLDEMRLAGATLPEQRTAHFVCAVTFAPADPGRPVICALGELAGVILGEPRGEGGFGYDPLFYIPGVGCTLAEAGSTVKNEISHRSAALRHLVAQPAFLFPKSAAELG